MSLYDLLLMIAVIAFYVLLAGRTIRLIRRGIQPWALGKGKKGIWRVLELFFIVYLGVWTWFVIVKIFHIPFSSGKAFFINSLFQLPVMQIIGLVVIYVGLVIFVLALKAFGDSWRIGIDKQKPAELIQNGVFGISRNPIFFFVDLFFLGVFFIHSTPFFLASAVLIISALHFQILEEEKFLIGHYGYEYSEYRKRVRRYI